MTNQPAGRPCALVTGASSGIGTAFAERLAHDQYDLILVARRRDRLEALAQRLSESQNCHADVIVADLTKPDDLHAVEKQIAEQAHLALLINNAGFGGYMPFVQLERDRAQDLINLQVLAVARLTHAALPGMIARQHGAIVNVSSRLAFSGSLGSNQLPKRATYAGTKAFINTFTQLLQSELEGTGVQVQALCPGVVETEFHEQAGINPSQYSTAIVMKPEDVVTASLEGLKRGEIICIPALEDIGLLTQVQDSEKRLFEMGRSGNLARRYAGAD